jgi:hypothetical protein
VRGSNLAIAVVAAVIAAAMPAYAQVSDLELAAAYCLGWDQETQSLANLPAELRAAAAARSNHTRAYLIAKGSFESYALPVVLAMNQGKNEAQQCITQVTAQTSQCEKLQCSRQCSTPANDPRGCYSCLQSCVRADICAHGRDRCDDIEKRLPF